MEFDNRGKNWDIIGLSSGSCELDLTKASPSILGSCAKDAWKGPFAVVSITLG